jgi:hypothetical protein
LIADLLPCVRHLLPVKRGARAEVRKLWPQNENGEPFLVPRLVSLLFYVPWQRPRNVVNGAHRKSGVIIRLSYACPVETYPLPSACFLLTPLRDELQAFSLLHPSARSEAVCGAETGSGTDVIWVKWIFRASL